MKPIVLDFFCGAGGFSEGFRQQGFEIKMGIDRYLPAIETFNHNFGLDCPIKNMLDFEHSIEEIEALPNTEHEPSTFKGKIFSTSLPMNSCFNSGDSCVISTGARNERNGEILLLRRTKQQDVSTSPRVGSLDMKRYWK